MSLSLANRLNDACHLTDNAVYDWYSAILDDEVILPDKHQLQLVKVLQHFSDKIADKGNDSWLSSMTAWARKKDEVSGIYIYGGAGCGKTFLMDGFYLQLRLEKKTRVHFHRFLLQVHASLKQHENADDALEQTALDLIERYDLICFDEFHVSDITDAMLLGRLLDKLLQGGVKFIFTSNYAPDNLYPNGLARDRFLPTIAMLKKEFIIFEFPRNTDYRDRIRAKRGRYFYPNNANNTALMNNFYAELAGAADKPAASNITNITVSGRQMAVVQAAAHCLWVDFKSLCVEARSQADYLQLADRYTTLFLSGVPKLDSGEWTEASRRFTWLVDILYDRKIMLVMMADVPLDKLYGDSEGGESGRTISRLREMRYYNFKKQ